MMANEVGSTLLNSLTNSTFDIGNMAKVLAEADVATQRASLERKSEKVDTELGALNYLETNLVAFQTYVADLTSPELFRNLSVESSNDSIVSATVAPGTAQGVFQIESKQLAQTHSVVFAQSYPSSQSLISDTGTFEFSVSGQSHVINLDATNGTLEGLQNQINSGDYGINAAVINDGTGYRLMLTSETPGEAGEMVFANTNPAGFPDSTDPASFVETSPAQNAVMSINGLDVSSNTNQFDNVIEGMSFQLNSASVGVVNTVTVGQDTARVEEAVRSFVDVYNQLGTIFSELGSYSASGLSEEELNSEEYEFYGDLAGSSLLRTVKEQIRSSMSGAINELTDGFNSLATIGLSFDREGVLNIDETVFSNVLNNQLDELGKVLSKGATSDSEMISFVNASQRTEAGNYQINITQEATRAEWTFAAQAGGTFDISVDGSTTVTLNAPTDATDLQNYALELTSLINNNSEFKSSGASVSAYVNASNEVVLQSNRYGVNSQIDLSIANTGDPALQNGQNVAGTIVTESGGSLSLNSYADPDDGRKINISDFAVADDGDTTMRGLSFDVLGNPGAAVAFNYTLGFASRLESTVNNLFKEENSLINQRIESLNTRSDEFDERSKKIDDRYAQLELKYRIQFSMLQSIMSNAEATRNQLNAQFNNNNDN